MSVGADSLPWLCCRTAPPDFELARTACLASPGRAGPTGAEQGQQTSNCNKKKAKYTYLEQKFAKCDCRFVQRVSPLMYTASQKGLGKSPSMYIIFINETVKFYVL